MPLEMYFSLKTEFQQLAQKKEYDYHKTTFLILASGCVATLF